MQDTPFDQTSDTPETVVGPTVKIQGDLNSDGNIRIHGQVSGTISTKQSVQVSDTALITADVVAGNAVIAGQVQGNLRISGQLVLQATAKINGDISCTTLRVEDGAMFTGKCSMGDTSTNTGKSRSHQTTLPEIERTETLND